MSTTALSAGAGIPTAPGRLPFVGHAVPLTRRPVDFVSSLREYGDVVRIYLGTMPTYFVTDAALVHRLLTTDSAKYTRGRVFDKARRFFGESVAIVTGPEHRAKRRLLQPVFAAQRVQTYVDVMAETVHDRIGTWRPGDRIAIEEETHQLSAELLARPLLGKNLTADDLVEICRCATIVMRGAYVRTVMPSAFEALPLPGNRAFARATARLQHIVQRLIDARRAHGDDEADLLSILLADGRMTDQQVYDELITILVGGLGNTAAAIAWTLYELARHPDVEARVHQEVDFVLGEGLVDAGAVRRLKFTARCVEEAVRPRGVWILIRRTLEPVELGDVHLPADTEVMYSITALHRDPRSFPDPTAFDPDRVLPMGAGALSRSAYMPFGAGAHKCIGEHFGTTAATLAVALIAHRWRLRRVPGVVTREAVDATVRPDRLPMAVEPR